MTKMSQYADFDVALYEPALLDRGGFLNSSLWGIPHAVTPEAIAQPGTQKVTTRVATLSRYSPAIVLWLLIFAAVPIALSFVPYAWDAAVYRNAIRSLQAGHDPYLDAIAAQKIYFSQIVHPAGDPPYGFVYSPIVIPLLRVIGGIPAGLSGVLYGALYVVSVFATIWVAALAFEDSERRVLLCLAPLTVFFPGLLANGIVLGGNVAYILYGMILSAAAYGWRRNRWLWFYLSVLAAACVKTPLLSLVVIPALTCRRQWAQVAITSSAGLCLFGLTAALWPTLFKHYLEAIDHQFLFYNDFGCSPAGLFSTVLDAYRVSYFPGALLFWGIYAAPLFGLLLLLSRRYLNGAFTFKQWLPVMLSGVVLLNPRLMEYDLFPITLPILILAWRFTRNYLQPVGAAISLALIFAVANAIAAASWTIWKFAGSLILVTYFLSGCWALLNHQPRTQMVDSPGTLLRHVGEGRAGGGGGKARDVDVVFDGEGDAVKGKPGPVLLGEPIRDGQGPVRGGRD